LVLELKKTSNPLGSDCDRRRLNGFQAELGYSFGALVECQTSKGKDPSIRVIEWTPDDGAPCYESFPAELGRE
ncbi:MAG TPA: hypothetical protein VLA60_12610, partial [Nitrospirales bacterium]|nr:hypothetical protein [Nitrospirales bacterium]